MIDAWDDACKRIVLEARERSVALDNHFLGSEHLAMAMLAQPTSRLSQLLSASRVSPAQALDLLEQACASSGLPRQESIPLTPRLRHIVRRADDLRGAFGEARIREAHLLSAMLSGGRGVFVRMLEAFGLQPETLVEALADDLEGAPAVPGQGAPLERTQAVRRAPPERAPMIDAASTLPLRPSAAHPVPAVAAHAAPEPAADAFLDDAAVTPRLITKLPLGANPALLHLPRVRGHRDSPGDVSRDAGGMLAQLGRDLTEEARTVPQSGLVDRDEVLEPLVRTLCRASRTNPLLVGEPGVGKTALVMSLARRIVAGQIPSALREVRLVDVPLAALATDTRFRGDLEKRLLALRDEAAAQNAMLVIDGVEALTASAPSAGEIGAILRPMLARGDLRMIATTTPAAYSRDIERDPVLARCFHVIRVDPPGPDVSTAIVNARCARFEAFHQVEIDAETPALAVRLATRHLRSRPMPDAAIDLLDEACVKAASERLADGAPPHRDGHAPPRVTPDTVAAVVSQRTGVPLERLTHDERVRLATLEHELTAQVVGQDDAVRRVSERIRMFKAGLRDERRPLGAFLFLGPTGVGKTELAKAMAMLLFSSPESLVRLDMSEYAEPHQVARLIGPPPGYVGFGEPGQLTEAVRRTPHCVILLDEIEKAHPRVFDLFLQVLDEGRLTDGRGTTTDFTHAIIVLTSNLGADLWKAEKRIGFRQRDAVTSATIDDSVVSASDEAEDDVARRRRIVEALTPPFRSEFLNRLDDVILFRPLDEAVLRRIATQVVARWQARSAEQGYPFDVDPSALDLLCRKGFDPDLGARPMKRAVEQALVAPLSRLMLDGDLARGTPLRAVERAGTIVFEPAT